MNEMTTNDKRSILDESICNCEFSVRTERVLSEAGLFTLGKLTETTSKQLLSYRGLGKLSFFEIRRKLCEHGLCLQDDMYISANDVREQILNIPVTLSSMEIQVREMRDILKNLEYYLENLRMTMSGK